MSSPAVDLSSYDDIPTPHHLYKYFRYHPPDENEWTQRLFRNSEVYFAAPEDFNEHRLHGALGYVPPVEFKQHWLAEHPTHSGTLPPGFDALCIKAERR